MNLELALDRHRAPLARILPFALFIAFLAATPLLAAALLGLDSSASGY